MALSTNDIDFRARSSSDEEREFLGHIFTNDVTYSDFDHASQVLLVEFEPEDESPIVFLRLRKAVRKHHLSVTSLAPFVSNGSEKLQAKVLPDNINSLNQVALDNKSIILVGERAARTPGLLTQVIKLAERTGAKMAWIPRRAGERGALAAGALGTQIGRAHV